MQETLDRIEIFEEGGYGLWKLQLDPRGRPVHNGSVGKKHEVFKQIIRDNFETFMDLVHIYRYQTVLVGTVFECIGFELKEWWERMTCEDPTSRFRGRASQHHPGR